MKKQYLYNIHKILVRLGENLVQKTCCQVLAIFIGCQNSLCWWVEFRLQQCHAIWNSSISCTIWSLTAAFHTPSQTMVFASPDTKNTGLNLHLYITHLSDKTHIQTSVHYTFVRQDTHTNICTLHICQTRHTCKHLYITHLSDKTHIQTSVHYTFVRQDTHTNICTLHICQTRHTYKHRHTTVHVDAHSHTLNISACM